MRCAKTSRRPSPPAGAWLVLAAIPLVLGGAGCGRAATEQDCDMIVDRYVEVELKALNVTDPRVVEQRKAEMRRDLKDDLKACPGKHITDSMLACVRQAASNAELDKCTRW
jgi:hypothetical protein